MMAVASLTASFFLYADDLTKLTKQISCLGTHKPSPTSNTNFTSLNKVKSEGYEDKRP